MVLEILHCFPLSSMSKSGLITFLDESWSVQFIIKAVLSFKNCDKLKIYEQICTKNVQLTKIRSYDLFPKCLCDHDSKSWWKVLFSYFKVLKTKLDTVFSLRHFTHNWPKFFHRVTKGIPSLSALVWKLA